MVQDVGANRLQTLSPSCPVYHKSTAFSWIQRVPRVHIRLTGHPGYKSPSLPMSPYPTPFQQCNASHSSSDCLCSLPSPLHTPPSDVRLEGGGMHSRDQSGPSAMGVDHSTTTELGTLVNLDGRLMQSLRSSYMWFGEGDLELIGPHPIDAGGFADVWEGTMGARRVAVRVWRPHLGGEWRACKLSWVRYKPNDARFSPDESHSPRSVRLQGFFDAEGPSTG